MRAVRAHLRQATDKPRVACSTAMVLHLRKPDVVDKPRIDLDAEADIDRCGALKEFWYVACLSTELPRNKPLARTLFGLPIALFRDERGVARAVRDRCLHRATA